jgi:cytidine deaminase
MAQFCPGAPAVPNSSLPWVLSAPLARSLSDAWRCSTADAFARELVPWAKAKHPLCGDASCLTPLSGFECHAVLTGASGAVYLGVNIEVPGTGEHTTLHAEQFASLLAAGVGQPEKSSPESGLVSLAQRGTGAPCGHCRQWLAEFVDAPELMLLGTAGGGVARPMRQLFPDAFGPASLNNSCPLLSTDSRCTRRLPPPAAVAPTDDPTALAAVRAALHAYTPYTGQRSGVALRTSSGEIYAAPTFESVALNPGVQPAVAALVALLVGGGTAPGDRWGSSIVYAVYAEEQPAEVAEAVEAQGGTVRASPRHAQGPRNAVSEIAAESARDERKRVAPMGARTRARSWPSYAAHTRAVVRSLAPNATVQTVHF